MLIYLRHLILVALLHQAKAEVNPDGQAPFAILVAVAICSVAQCVGWQYFSY